MPIFDWHTFLKDWSRAILVSPEVEYYNLPKKAIKSEWLGFEAASEEQILQVEAKLGSPLPPSYRAFLRVSNGWRNTGTFIDRILPVEQIYWFCDTKDKLLLEHAQMYINQMENIPFDPDHDEVDYSHFMDTLVIVRPSDEQGLYLLNPQVRNDDGEWQAWVFGHWIPGAYAYTSFQALLEDEYQTVREDVAFTTNHISLDDDNATLIKKLDYLIETIEAELKRATPDEARADHPNYEDAVQYVRGLQEVLDRIITIKQPDHDAKKIYQQLDLLVRHYDGKQRDQVPSFPTGQDATDLINAVMNIKDIKDPDLPNLMSRMLQSSFQSGAIKGNMWAIDRLRYLLHS